MTVEPHTEKQTWHNLRETVNLQWVPSNLISNEDSGLFKKI